MQRLLNVRPASINFTCRLKWWRPDGWMTFRMGLSYRKRSTNSEARSMYAVIEAAESQIAC